MCRADVTRPPRPIQRDAVGLPRDAGDEPQRPHDDMGTTCRPVTKTRRSRPRCRSRKWPDHALPVDPGPTPSTSTQPLEQAPPTEQSRLRSAGSTEAEPPRTCVKRKPDTTRYPSVASAPHGVATVRRIAPHRAQTPRDVLETESRKPRSAAWVAPGVGDERRVTRSPRRMGGPRDASWEAFRRQDEEGEPSRTDIDVSRCARMLPSTHAGRR